MIAGQHASCAMWRSPWQTRFSGNPRQPRRRDPRCGTRAAPRTRPPSPACLATPVPRRARNAVHADRGAAPKHGSARLTTSVRECEGKELERPAPQGWRHSRPGTGARDGIGLDGRNEVRTSAVLKAPMVGPLDRALPLGTDDAPRRITPAARRARRPGGRHGQAMGRAAIDNRTPGTPSVRSDRRSRRHGEGSPLEGLAFPCSMHAGPPARPG